MSWADGIKADAESALADISKEPAADRPTVAASSVLYQMRVLQLIMFGMDVPPQQVDPLAQASNRLHEAAAWMEAVLDGLPSVPAEESDPGAAAVALEEDDSSQG